MARLDAWNPWKLEGWGLRERADTPPPSADTWRLRMEELLALRTLEEDWDGQGAKAPSVDLVDSALHLAERLRQQGIDAPCRIVPGVNGTVIFEWQQDGIYREMEVTRPGHAEIMEMSADRTPKHWTVTDESPQ